MPHDPTSPKSGLVLNTSLRLSPEQIEEADRHLDAMNELLGDGPPTDRRRSLSQIAIRSDGAMLVSTEDAVEHFNLEGRELQSFMVLNAEEAAWIRDSGREFLDDRAARVLGKLPRRAT